MKPKKLFFNLKILNPTSETKSFITLMKSNHAPDLIRNIFSTAAKKHIDNTYHDQKRCYRVLQKGSFLGHTCPPLESHSQGYSYSWLEYFKAII